MSFTLIPDTFFVENPGLYCKGHANGYALEIIDSDNPVSMTTASTGARISVAMDLLSMVDNSSLRLTDVDIRISLKMAFLFLN